MRLRSVRSIKDLKGKRVLMRVDFDVAVMGGKVQKQDLARVRAALPTIQFLRKSGARVVLIAHRGRPAGQRAPALSLKPVARALEKLLRAHIKFCATMVGPGAVRAVDHLKPAEVLVLENLRFHAGEERNDHVFARQLADLGDLYVNDAFATSHRAHASFVGIPKYLPSYAGWRLQKEVQVLTRLLNKPRRPFVVLMGGAKLETKLPTIKHLLKKADFVLIGGALANTFFLAQGHSLGASLVEKGFIAQAKTLLKNKKNILPVDVRVAQESGSRPLLVQRLSNELGVGDSIVDIGPKTVQLFADYIRRANTIMWNGPVGLCETPNFAEGTKALAREIIRRAGTSAFVVVGGGDTLPCLAGLPGVSNIDFISMGGGAMLEYLSGNILPGIKPLVSK